MAASFVMAYFVYILYSSKLDKFYVGQTENVTNRVDFHNDLVRNNIWTKRGIPWELKVSFNCGSRADAMQLEKKIKNMKSRKLVEFLVGNPEGDLNQLINTFLMNFKNERG